MLICHICTCCTSAIVLTCFLYLKVVSWMFLTAIQMFSLYSCQLFGFRKYTLSDLKITVDMNWFFFNLTVKFLPSVFWSDFSFMSVRFALDPKCFLFCISTLCTFRSVFADSWQCLDVISYSCFSTDTDNAGRTHVRSTLTSGLKPFQYIAPKFNCGTDSYNCK